MNITWKSRVYEQFLMPSRLPEYANLLKAAVDRGYVAFPLLEFYRQASSGTIPSKCLLLRHDVDTDVPTAKLMYAVERQLGIRSSWFFRLSTLDIPFMQRLDRDGNEASYHFEEIATFAKNEALVTRKEVEAHMPRVRKIFQNNMEQLRHRSGLSMRVIASHGDFMNRRLGIRNHELLTQELRNQMDIELEAYDNCLTQYFTDRISDATYPITWKPVPPTEALKKDQAVLHILVHPSHWRANIPANILATGQRVLEDVSYRLRARTKRPARSM
jgi:hypothetical protein